MGWENRSDGELVELMIAAILRQRRLRAALGLLEEAGVTEASTAHRAVRGLILEQTALVDRLTVAVDTRLGTTVKVDE